VIARRSILQGLVALVAAPAIVRVASLMPCAPTEVIRPGNQWLTLNEITREAVRRFEDTNALIKSMDEQYREDFEFVSGAQWPSGFDALGAKVGGTLRIRLPNDYTVTDGPSLVCQEPAERMVYVKARRTLVPESQVVDALAVVAVAAVAVPKLLEKPVTRRLWALPQHSAAPEERGP